MMNHKIRNAYIFSVYEFNIYFWMYLDRQAQLVTKTTEPF